MSKIIELSDDVAQAAELLQDKIDNGNFYGWLCFRVEKKHIPIWYMGATFKPDGTTDWRELGVPWKTINTP